MEGPDCFPRFHLGATNSGATRHCVSPDGLQMKHTRQNKGELKSKVSELTRNVKESGTSQMSGKL